METKSGSEGRQIHTLNRIKFYREFKNVLQLTKEERILDREIIALHKNIWIAADEDLKNARKILECCGGEKRSYKGYKWMMKVDYKREKMACIKACN